MVSSLKKFVTDVGDDVMSQWASAQVVHTHTDNVDITTNFDRDIERKFHQFVTKNFPGTGFRGEELPELNSEEEYTWYIDPIDGTKWFANGVPLWTISIALVKAETHQPILGLIYNPTSKQLYHAVHDNGSFLNDKKLSLSKETDISKLQIALDLTSHSTGWAKYEEQILQSIVALNRDCYRVRAIGLGTSSLTWVAQGMFGAFVSPLFHRSKDVDIMAGRIIATEAGADFWVRNLEQNLQQIVVARKPVIEKLIPLLV